MGILAQGLVSLAGRGGGSMGGLTAAEVAVLAGGAGKEGADPFTAAADITQIKHKCISSKINITADVKEHSSRIVSE